MTTYTTTSHPTDHRLCYLTVDDVRYVMRADLSWDSRDGFTEQHASTCKCCNKTTYSPMWGGRTAKDIDELLELGWAMTEEAYEEWKKR